MNMEQGMNDKVIRFKAKAEVFLNTKTKAFIVDADNNFYFCDIIFVGDVYCEVISFAGNRNGEKNRLYYVDILRFEEYAELREEK